MTRFDEHAKLTFGRALCLGECHQCRTAAIYPPPETRLPALAERTQERGCRGLSGYGAGRLRLPNQLKIVIETSATITQVAVDIILGPIDMSERRYRRRGRCASGMPHAFS